MKIFDLSDTLRDGTVEPIIAHKIEYIPHEMGAKAAAETYGLQVSDFPDGRAWARDIVVLTTHSGTHVDAPYHFGPVCEGKPARTIDQLPLDWFYGDGVVLDFTHKQAGDLVTAEEVRDALRRINYSLKPGEIVLVRTDAYKHFGKPGYENLHPGMSREATLWLIDHGVRLMGIDAWGWDRPFNVMAEDCRQGKNNVLWAAHFAGKEREYCHIEKLCNLDQLPRPYGFRVAAFPVKIHAASGGWAKVVAIFDDD